VTSLVAAPGDNNLSDATEPGLF